MVNTVVTNYLEKQLNQVLHTNANDLKKSGNHFLYPVMPLTAIHLYSNKSYEYEVNGNITYVFIFSAIAIFILLIACVNFMNLSTARSANRAKEVGIRKVVGSLRSSLITQFLTESVLVSFYFPAFCHFGCVVADASVQPACRETNEYPHTFFFLVLLPVMVALIIVVGIVAGSYPAFFLSSFQPVQVLKGSVARGFKKRLAKKFPGCFPVFYFHYTDHRHHCYI